MDPWEREILDAVAAGRLSPEQAATALDAGAPEGVDAADAPDAATTEPIDTPPPPPAGDPPPPPGGRGDFRLKITAAARSVRVVADPNVAEASVEGRHRAERVGDTLVIEGLPKPDDESGFSFEGPGSWHRQWHSWRQFTEPLVIRVRPSAAVEVEVSAGSLNVQGVSGPVSAVIAAGSARLDDVRGPLDVECRAGAVRISGKIDVHPCHIRCEAGSVNLHLSPGSSATVRARAELGRIRIHGKPASDSFLGGSREARVGAGAATVEVDTTMGSVDIFSDEWATTAGATAAAP